MPGFLLGIPNPVCHPIFSCETGRYTQNLAMSDYLNSIDFPTEGVEDARQSKKLDISNATIVVGCSKENHC